ncbi:hypothetical protein AB0C38_05835 [Amycolatopsis sp. NPDC048633]|uniref:hypothetical protein n=1 Tax=Amycolatopsis sp. NPDC048633 TaxID=3157095 RepID=UPI0033CCA19C
MPYTSVSSDGVGSSDTVKLPPPSWDAQICSRGLEYPAASSSGPAAATVDGPFAPVTPSRSGITTVRSVLPSSGDTQATGRVVFASRNAVPTATRLPPDRVSAFESRRPRSSPSSVTVPPASRCENFVPTPDTEPSGPGTAATAGRPPPIGPIRNVVQSAPPVQFTVSMRLPVA